MPPPAEEHGLAFQGRYTPRNTREGCDEHRTSVAESFPRALLAGIRPDGAVDAAFDANLSGTRSAPSPYKPTGASCA